MKYSEFLNYCDAEFEKAIEIMEQEFGYQSDEQLRWKPSPKSWSMLECLDHLIVSDTKYYPKLEAVISRHKPVGIEKEVQWNWMGRWLVNGVNPANMKRIPAPTVFQPSKDKNFVPSEVINAYKEDIENLRSWLKKFEGYDLNSIMISSPVLFLIRLNLSSVFQIFVYHHHRHLGQAVRVKRNANFPKR